MVQLECENSIIRFESVFDGSLSQLLRDEFSTAKKAILTDETVYALWGEKFVLMIEELHQAELIVIPAGEANKNLAICDQVWGALSEYEFGRNDLLINLGGGVVTDLGGFVASTYKRGMSFIHLPTTLLSQVDASVGGKTGIDHGPYKNQIGVFSSPAYVYVDHTFLSTLEEDQLRSGYAEMLKHGLIADADHFSLVQSMDPTNYEQLSTVIAESVRIKSEIVKADPKEESIRKKLNLGHTIGHALEGYALQLEIPLLHGYAVAYGILAEAHLANQKGLLGTDELETIGSIVERIYPRLNPELLEDKVLLQLMRNDKKNENDQINFTLLEKLGSCRINEYCSDEEIQAALNFIRHPST